MAIIGPNNVNISGKRYSLLIVMAAAAILLLCSYAVLGDQGKKVEGACQSVQLGQGGNTEQSVLKAIKRMGVDPGKVANIHDAAIKGYDPTEQNPSSYVRVCLTPNSREVASVNGINAEG